MMLEADKIRRLDEIKDRLRHVSSGPWRNTIRRESSSDVAKAIESTGGLGISLCSESVVNTGKTPTVKNVICWMGPAAGEHGDDRMDATFIAHARSDIEWLIDLVESISKSTT